MGPLYTVEDISVFKVFCGLDEIETLYELYEICATRSL